VTLMETRVESPADDQVASSRGWSDRKRGLLTGLAVAVVVAVLAQFPLLHNRIFYFWDDSAAAFLPDWHYIGNQLLNGTWPTMSPEMWMGGNIAGETMMGLFNPLLLVNYLLVAVLPDLAVSAILVKTEFLVILALGVYLLARNFGAGRRAASVTAIALPVSGYILYFDAATWVGGLIAFAFLPWVWWSLRKFAHGELNPLVVVLIGYLAMTAGNPYGALGVAVIVLAVAVEQIAQRDWRRFGKVVLVGAIVGLGTLVVYLPLVGSSAVTWRSSAGVANDGFMVPGIGDLLAMSAPVYQPQFSLFGGGTVATVPIAYLAWFVVPLAPWLRWSTLRHNVRARSSILVFATVYLVFLFGPSNLWLFRWPARLTGYVYLPVAIAIAIVLTKGLKTDHIRERAGGSLLIVLVGTYLSWAAAPKNVAWQVLTTVLVLGLLVGVVYTYRKRPHLFGGVLVLGTALMLLCQVSVFTGNYSVTPWRFPHNVADLKARFADRYEGNTLFATDTSTLSARGLITPEGAWQDVMLTNMAHTAGVDALNSYSGIGDVKFASALCMTYYGGTCTDVFPKLFERAPGTTADLADVLRLQTVVLDKTFESEPTPDGWSIAERTDLVTVYKRNEPLPFPSGRMSWSASSVTVDKDEKVGENGERFTYTGEGRVVLSMLAWPGYVATVDGKKVDVEQGPAGLMQIDLPEGRNAEVELSFTPPGYGLGIPLMAGCLLLGVAYGVWWEIARRRTRTRAKVEAEADATPAS
jgi:hypothetical protein